ncbi:glycoside hydrolase family 20 [Prevotella sp. CAG:1092]|nr:glycoside hydrolase family 20 [Prevotella sp. CAG:1092]
MKWVAQCCNIEDAPRFGYRGFHLDPCRHFITVENVKKQLDLMSMFKVNTMHFHLTEDQGWRIEIKKYPKLTTIGSIRTEGDGSSYGGYYTQEQIKEIVDYAAKRYITVIPEIDLPGHMMAAIAAYPNLSCKGEKWSPRTVWGIEDLVMCAGKEDMFNFLGDIFDEIVPLFPGKYFHIGGDECPKTSWKNCPTCQKRIKDEGLQAEGKHTAEERLQSYVIKRVEKMLEKRGRKIIGWDEILEGGLSENATVMSWRGTQGGIEAAMQKHDVIMTPGSDGMYLDWYQGDSKIEHVTIPSPPRYLSSTYNYNPVPDTIKTLGLAHHILGVQCNNWSEYMYTNAKMEYMMYPRAVALSEIAWSPLNKKNFKDFCRRLDANSIRLDEHNITYHMPLPEQPYGSCDKVVITKDTTVTFTTSRPIKMVYTLDGTTPTPSSTVYTVPISVSGNTIIRIATVLPTGKMSKIRTVEVEKQAYAPAVKVEAPKQGLKIKRIKGNFLKVNQLELADGTWEYTDIDSLKDIKIKQIDDAATLRGANNYAAIAEGYINIPEDGVYYLSSRFEQVWIDNKLVINNEGDVKASTTNDSSVALAKGLHPIKIVFLSNIVGGWPSWWSKISIEMRKDSEQQFTEVDDSQYYKQ